MHADPSRSQLYISDSGHIEAQPFTWDAEPLYSPSTVREGLFAPDAFEQIAGQTALELGAPEAQR